MLINYQPMVAHSWQNEQMAPSRFPASGGHHQPRGADQGRQVIGSCCSGWSSSCLVRSNVWNVLSQPGSLDLTVTFGCDRCQLPVPTVMGSLVVWILCRHLLVEVCTVAGGASHVGPKRSNKCGCCSPIVAPHFFFLRGSLLFASNASGPLDSCQQRPHAAVCC